MALTQRVGVESPSRALYPSMRAQGPPGSTRCNKLSSPAPMGMGMVFPRHLGRSHVSLTTGLAEPTNHHVSRRNSQTRRVPRDADLVLQLNARRFITFDEPCT